MNDISSSSAETARATNDSQQCPLDIQRWYRRVYAQCRSRLISVSDSEDATQEVFVRAITRVSELRNESALGGWLRQIANHVCVDMIRRQRVRRTDSMDMQTVPGDGGSQSVCDKDQQEHLMSLINALPETHREIVLLHYYEDMTYAEIAQWLGVARSTVSERLNKARQMLRSGLATTRSTP